MIERTSFFRTAALLWLIAVLHCVSVQAQGGNPEAHKFDEMQPRYIGDMKMRLYHFSDEGLQREPKSKAYIIGYNGRRKRLMKTMFSPESVKEWLIQANGVKAERIVTINGGYREVPTLEFWLVPEGASPPVPTPSFYPKKKKRR